MTGRAAFASLVVVTLMGLALAGCRGQDYQPNRNRAPVGQGRSHYNHLDDLGDIKRRGGILDLERGYYSGDLHLTGTGMEKRGAGTGESVIDGNVRIDGTGWILKGMTIRGDVVIAGDENDLRGAKVLGRVAVENGLDNHY